VEVHLSNVFERAGGAVEFARSTRYPDWIRHDREQPWCNRQRAGLGDVKRDRVARVGGPVMLNAEDAGSVGSWRAAFGSEQRGRHGAFQVASRTPKRGFRIDKIRHD